MRGMTAFRERLGRFRAQPELGATAVLAGILMVGLVGFTGLAVDGGATYAKHQELQNGADAAALAAAQECADNVDNCDEDYLEIEAGPYGEDNVRNDKDTVSTSFDPDVPARTVTATVTGTQFHWFMPVVGLSESELSAGATATWGSPRSGPSMLPLVISECNLLDVLDEGLGTIIEIHMPKGGEEEPCSWGSEYPPGGFGWLTKGGCEVPVTVGEWESGDPGADAPTDCDWESYIGEVVLVPIFDLARDVGRGQEFQIARFAALEVLGIKYENGGGQVGEPCAPPEPRSKYMDICIRGTFIEYVTTADGYDTGGPDTEVRVVRLID